MTPVLSFTVAFLFLAVGAALAVLAWSGHAVSDGSLAASGAPLLLPKILLMGWLGIGLVVVVSEGMKLWRRRRGGDSGLEQSPLLLGLLLLLVAGGIRPLGFLIPLTLAVTVGLWLMGERSVFRLVVVTALLGPGVWFLFHHVLLIRLPSLLSGGIM